MSAFVRVSEGEREGAAELDASLKAAGIVHGIDPIAYAVLITALASEQSAPELEIARGTAAGSARDGHFEPAFHPGLQPGHVREDGTVDFHDRELLKPVSRGEVLGRVYPPGEGPSGLRVDGVAIAAKQGRAHAPELGAGAELLADNRVLATRTGVVIYVEGRSIDVGTRYEHKGNVDLRVGDLSMEGSLVVRGDVERGFSVRASGDLEIKGDVDGGSARAGANLKIAGTVRGSEGSIVSSGGDLHARHVERARLDSGGILELTDAVNSALSAVTIRADRSLRGGHAAVEVGLVTRDAGTPTALVDTVLEAGAPREDRAADACATLETAKAQRIVARRMLGMRASLGHRAEPGKLARGLAAVQSHVIARKIQRVERIAGLLPLAFIEVQGTAYPGVHVRIGDAHLLVEDAMRSVRFTLDVERRTIRTEGAKE
ncbi:MAG TPA: FapA family protein, partial [Polyangiaceae bacterium]|nr:FapA family protein [Polyangiaceae bacterium]